ncbi:MAG: ABC transporter permease [Deltaproteobacteria bacterium]|nr:ABC transporter permease [Deltaproteobacteria bacterium]
MRGYAVRIAFRYLMAKKKAFISFITMMAVVGVAIGVAALTTIIGASSGLQTAITDKVVGVNSHVLVMTGGWEFDRYEDTLRLARSIDGVVGAAPFVINERMILKGARTHGVLVKGVDPERSAAVLDVAHQITRPDGAAGSLRDLRASDDAEARMAERTAKSSARKEPTTDPFVVWDGGLDRDEPREPAAPEVPAAPPTPGPGIPEPGPGTDAPPAPLDPDPPALPPEARAPRGRPVAASAAAGDPLTDPELLSITDVLAAKKPDRAVPPANRPTPPAGDLFHDGDYDPSLFGPPGPSTPDPLADVIDHASDGVVDATDGARALPGLILGRTLAESLGVKGGDVVKIVSPSGSIGFGFGGQPGPSDVAFQVVGIFYSGFNEYDSRLVYIHLREAQAMFQRGDTVTGVELRLDDLDRADDVARDLRALLAAYDTIEGLQGVRGGFLRTGAAWDRFPSRRWLPRRAAALATLPATLLADSSHQAAYRVITWKELNKNLFQALWIQKMVLTIVLAVVVGIAAFNIVSTLIMIVLEKKKEIAILKSMGSTNADVRAVFLTVGTVIGLVGLSIGLGLGYAISALLRAYAWPLDPKVYMIDHLPVDIRAFDYVLCASIAFVICLVATLIPSWRAARMHPVEGLHYE